MFVTFDPSQAFPREPLFGRGTVERKTSRAENGEVVVEQIHTPPEGMESVWIDDAEFIHGTEESLYVLEEGPTLRALTDEELAAVGLPALQEAKGDELRAATQASILQPLLSNVLGSDHVYPTDKDTQSNVHGLVTKAMIYPAEGPFPVWCTPAGADNWRRRGHGDEQIKALGNQYVAHVSARQDQYESLLGQVKAVVADYEAGNITAAEARDQINAIEWTEPGA